MKLSSKSTFSPFGNSLFLLLVRPVSVVWYGILHHCLKRSSSTVLPPFGTPYYIWSPFGTPYYFWLPFGTAFWSTFVAADILYGVWYGYSKNRIQYSLGKNFRQLEHDAQEVDYSSWSGKFWKLSPIVDRFRKCSQGIQRAL